MAKRLLTAAIGVPVGILIIWLSSLTPHVMAGATVILSVIAVFEVISAAKYSKYKSLTALCLIFSGVLPLFFCYDILRTYAVPLAFLFLVLMFALTLTRHKEIKFDELGFMVMFTILIPMAIATLAFFDFQWPKHGTFLVVYTLVTAWIADGGAYFAGTFFGKHKLSPEISPKKTWEGFFGGMVTTILFAVGLGYGYELLDKLTTGDNHFTVNIWLLVIMAFVSTFLGLLGDLIASLIKRQCGVKDFGNILPGHGGIMDRFDSVLLVAPFIYLMCKFIFPITETIIM